MQHSSSELEPGLSVQILHKPLGNGARWVPIDAESRIRVPPQGKPVRLVVRCLLPGVVPLWETLNFSVKCRLEKPITKDGRIEDVWESLPTESSLALTGPVAQSPAPDGEPPSRIFAAKLLVLRKTVIFNAQLQCTMGKRNANLTGSSVVFSTSNSGPNPAHRKPKETNPASGPERFSISSSSTSSNSSPLSTSPGAPLLPAESLSPDENSQELSDCPQSKDGESGLSDFQVDGNLHVEGHMRGGACILFFRFTNFSYTIMNPQASL